MIMRPHQPWFNNVIKEEKRKRQRFERAMKTKPSDETEKQFKMQKNYVNWMIDKAQCEYYSSKVEGCGSNQRALFNLVKSLCGQRDETPLPEHDSARQLCEDFSEFLVTKIKNIRLKLDTDTLDNVDMSVDPANVDVEPLTSFKQLSHDEIRTIVMKCATTSCDLDPVSTPILKECIDILLPIISLIVNESLQSGN